MSEVKEGGMLLLRVEVTIALSILKRVATRFAACERGNKVIFNLLFLYFSCRKLTRLSLITIQVVCNIYNTTLQPGSSHGLVCMHALYCIILLDKSGVLQTCQHCNKQQYNSIQQHTTDRTNSKNIFT